MQEKLTIIPFRPPYIQLEQDRTPQIRPRVQIAATERENTKKDLQESETA